MQTDAYKTERLYEIIVSEGSNLGKYFGMEKIIYGMDAKSISLLIQEVISKAMLIQKNSRDANKIENLYDPAFFETLHEGSLRSARVIAPLLIDAVKPNSVVDVGCGDGTWLSIFFELGIKNIKGYDGNWVDRKSLYIPEKTFEAVDLSKTKIETTERYDLVVSLECGEHIEKQYADQFVESLCNLGPVVCFSAALPFQGGVNHINEQWPEYWANLFANRGFKVMDCIRPIIWHNSDVQPWYAQNIFLFADQNKIDQNPAMLKWAEKTDPKDLTKIHPILYLIKIFFLIPELAKG